MEREMVEEELHLKMDQFQGERSISLRPLVQQTFDLPTDVPIDPGLSSSLNR